MARLNLTQRKIMRSIFNSDRYTLTSLFRLACDLEIDYSYAWYCVKLLQARGLIYVDRPNGRDLVMSAFPPLTPQKRSFTRGGVFQDSQPVTYNPQNGGPSMDDIQKLRDDLEPPADYPRPVLSKEEQETYAKQAKKINAIRDQVLRLIYVAKMVEENVRLLKEVNEHRAARGLALLPVYDPERK